MWDSLDKAKMTYKLSRIGFTGEVDYPKWVSNVVMVKKNPGEVEDVHRLHRSQQGLSQRKFPPPWN